MGSTILCLYSEPEIRLYQSVRSVEQDVMSGEAEKCLIFSVFFLLFLGPKFDPISLAKKYVFSPILKENSPQNEVFKKKNRQNVTTACRKCV